MKSPKYNTLFDIAFSYEHDYEDPHDVPPEQLIKALEERVRYLKDNPVEAEGAFGVNDTYEIPTNEGNDANTSSN